MQDLKLECLLNNTQNVLKELIKNEYMKNFVLVAGSALALHLCHRCSEDLDFFTYEDTLNKKKILRLIKNFKNKEIVNISDEQIDVILNRAKVTFFIIKINIENKIIHN